MRFKTAITILKGLRQEEHYASSQSLNRRAALDDAINAFYDHGAKRRPWKYYKIGIVKK